MGMFTTIIDLLDREYQIRTGEDDCNTYRVGQTVHWWVDRNIVGRSVLLDGVYPGEPTKAEWPVTNIVIRNHVVLGVFPDKTIEELEIKYQIKPPPKSLWSARAWKELHNKRRHQKRLARRTTRWFHTMKREEWIPAVMGRFTRRRLKEKSFLRQILAPEALNVPSNT